MLFIYHSLLITEKQEGRKEGRKEGNRLDE